MTTPDSFEYTDDSVVARVSVDIPNQAVADISQLTSAMSAMRTELESIARAQSSWLDYLQQMPVIVEQSNQAIRNQITLMERMSYLQSEVGGTGTGGEPAFSPDGSGGGGRPMGGPNSGSSGGYSTAAPAGYVNPFMNMMSGTGAHGGFNDLNEAQGYMQNMAGQDPRMYANMAAARGLPVNPATIGMVGGMAASVLGKMGGTGGGSGHGADSSGSQSPQPTQPQRDSSAPPDPGQRGQPTTSQSQDEPPEPHPDSPAWQQYGASVIQGAKQLFNEMRSRGGSGGAGGVLGGMAKIGSLGSTLFGGAAAAKGMLKGGAALGGAAVAAHQIQNIGESITEYQQLGSVRGGDYATGIKYEMENRIRALDPFVNLPQTREAMQAAFSSGFIGDDREQVQSMAITNFKELGVSMQETARMMESAMVGMNKKDEGSVLRTRSELDAVLNTMKELSADGGASFPERQQQLSKALGTLVSMGMDPATVERGQLQLQEGYGDERALSKTIGDISQGVMQSPRLSLIAGQRLGITGHLPEALPAVFAKAGITDAEVLEAAGAEMARAVSGIPGYEDKIATFMRLMNQESPRPLSYEEAESLYKKVTGKKAPSEIAAEKVTQQGTQKNKQTNWNPISYIGDVLSPTLNARSLSDFKNIPGDTMDAIRGLHPASENAERAAAMFGGNDRPSNPFSPSGQNGKNLPTNSSQMPPKVDTSGTVSGAVTITVDQSGRVTAPPSIQLTGVQKSALAGFGSSQVNNPSPGDPDYFHSSAPFGGR